jgi:hypothetical protein
MKNSDTFRENAENCLELADGAANEQAAVRYRRMAQAWTDLAKEQDWLDGHLTQAERATQLAADVIDGMGDNTASTADVESRKRRLIDGPAEFQDTRDTIKKH